MPLWCVFIKQINKTSGVELNEFNLSVKADNKAEATTNALKEMDQLNMIQALHVQDGPFANSQLRPYRRLTWKNARNIVVSVKRVRE